MTEVFFVAYFLVLIASLVIKTPVIKGPWLFLLRAFFPNWKLFHAVGYVPHLYARSSVELASGELQWSEWVLIYPRRLTPPAPFGAQPRHQHRPGPTKHGGPLLG